MYHRALLVALFLGLAAPLPAQELRPSLDSGSRVRVTLTSEDSALVMGSFLQMDWRSLVIRERSSAERAREWTEVRLLEVSRGHDRGSSAWKTGLAGAFVGTALGSFAGALAAQDLPTGTAETMLYGGLGVGLVSGGIGAGIGALFPRERWEPYVRGVEHLPPAPAPVLVAESAPAPAPVVVDSASVDAAPADAAAPDPAALPAPEPEPAPAALPATAPTPAPASTPAPAPAPSPRPAPAPTPR